MSFFQLFSNSLKARLWWRQLSISAPKVAIRPSIPLPVRIILISILIGLSGAIAMWAYDLGRRITGLHPNEMKAQLAASHLQIEKLRRERDQFSATVNAAESQLNIEHSAQKQLMMQVKSLEGENTRLKEDLAFFESLLPTDASAQGVALRRFKANLLAPNQLQYQLLVMQSGKGQHDFLGKLQLAVTTLQAGKSVMMVFPDEKTLDTDQFKLEFKHYQRMEGVLTLPEGTVIKAVQARILERGQIRAQQSANL